MVAPIVGQRLKIACSLFKISKSKGEEGELSKRIRPIKGRGRARPQAETEGARRGVP